MTMARLFFVKRGGRIKDASNFFFSLLRRMLSSRFGRVGDVGGGHCFTFATIRAAAAGGDDDGEERYPRKIAARDSFFFGGREWPNQNFKRILLSSTSFVCGENQQQ